jgi:hypothetical protein
MEERMRIVVNGKPFEVDVITIGYTEIVHLAGYRRLHPSVTYRQPGIRSSGGILMPGGAVSVVDGMVFNVVDTSNA